MKYAYTYILDTMADWELGYIIAELNSGQYFKRKGERIAVKTVAATMEPVTTKGGMTIVPDMTVNDIDVGSTAVLLLPGADTWQAPEHAAVIEKAKRILDADGTVAAICGATAALAEAGIFDRRPHTSNAPEYLKMMAPNYHGHDHYRADRAVADGSLITASSAGALAWARLILERLDVFSDATLRAWYQYHETGDAQYFFQLLESVPKK